MPPGGPGDWLLVAGDVGERFADIEWALGVLASRYERVVWVPGNHELWSRRADPVGARGVERYSLLIEACRQLGIVTPQDPYPVWDGPPEIGAVTIAPLFVGYDYSFLPEGASSKREGLAIAERSGIISSDERLLHPDPYPSREEWCRARVAESEARLAAVDRSRPLILLNHYPLVREPTRIMRYPQFAQWCGTGQVPVHDGVRFEEVSVGYPREWQRRAARLGSSRGPGLPWQVLPALPHGAAALPPGAPAGLRG
jgi:hypothetical protein